MCIISACIKRKMTRSEFKECFSSNKDGFGYAYSLGNGLSFYEKGIMSEEEAWAKYDNIKVLPHVAHFRIATAGGVCPELTHPFIISKNSPLSLSGTTNCDLLFHNGVMSDWRSFLISTSLDNGKLPTDSISDTRVLAMMISKLGVGVLEFISAGKVIVLTKKGKLMSCGDFISENGISFSNSTYKEYVYSASSYWDKDYGWSRKDHTYNDEPKLIIEDAPNYPDKGNESITITGDEFPNLDSIEDDSEEFSQTFLNKEYNTLFGKKYRDWDVRNKNRIGDRFKRNSEALKHKIDSEIKEFMDERKKRN